MNNKNEAFAIRAIIIGRVQGVFFRQSTCDKARELKLGGWTKNKDDGSVEVYACGDNDSVMQLIEWLHRGPRIACVDRVDWHETEFKPNDTFKILRD